MNYTKNHHLPQWVTSDRVKMDDFNAAMANIENGLNTADSALATANSAQSAATSAQTTANTANTKATAAQSTANSANTKATAAQTAANAASAKANAAYSPDNLPYVIGSYTGNGLASQVIELGFEPSFIIVSGMTTGFDAADCSPISKYFAIVGNTHSNRGQLYYRLQFLNDAFAVFKVDNYGSQLPILNEKDRTYFFIAFR